MTRSQLIRYALLAMPLAFAALPLYVLLPNYYATHYGISLATLGSLLLLARLCDAIADPLIGHYVDRVFALSRAALMRRAYLAALLMLIGFIALWWAPRLSPPLQLTLLVIALALAYAAYSFLTVLHQGIGAQLSRDTAMLTRINAFRESGSLIGVLIASLAPLVWGVSSLPVVLATCLVIATMALRSALKSSPLIPHKFYIHSLVNAILRIRYNVNFTNLCIVYVLNGIAAAVPATLLLFFVQDRLQVADSGPFLFAYFLSAAFSLPLWLKLSARFGLERAWLIGMLLAIISFIGASTLRAGDAGQFIMVCIATGIAAGADLALPGAMVARCIHAAGHSGELEGSYYGLWAFLTKLNLALAAGLSLPLLQWLGYSAGTRDTQALNALSIAYGAVPCVLKLLAALGLWRLLIRPTTRPLITSESPSS